MFPSHSGSLPYNIDRRRCVPELRFTRRRHAQLQPDRDREHFVLSGASYIPLLQRSESFIRTDLLPVQMRYSACLVGNYRARRRIGSPISVQQHQCQCHIQRSESGTGVRVHLRLQRLRKRNRDVPQHTDDPWRLCLRRKHAVRITFS